MQREIYGSSMSLYLRMRFCADGGGVHQIGGPMWLGPIHNVPFVDKMLTHIRANKSSYGTSTRVEGMLSVAKSVSDKLRVKLSMLLIPGRVC